MADQKNVLNTVTSEKPVSSTVYFRKNPGKAALALFSSLFTGFLLGFLVYVLLMRFFSLSPYISICFSSPVSVITALYLNAIIKTIIIKKYN